MSGVLELITALSDVGAKVAEACSVGHRCGLVVLHQCGLVLFKVALVLYLCSLSACIYIMVSYAVAQSAVHTECPPGARCRVDHEIPSVSRGLVGLYADDAHITFHLVFGRRGGEYIYALDACRCYHLQGFSACERTGFAIYIHQKTAAAPQCQLPIGIHLHAG